MKAYIKDEDKEIEFEVAEETRPGEQTKVKIKGTDRIIAAPKQIGPPLDHTVTIDGVTYTLMLSGVAERKAFYRVISKRKLMGTA